MSNEIWKTIPEFPRYAVSTEGRIRNHLTGKFVSASVNNFGHLRVNLLGRDGRRGMSLALLVAEAFVDPPDPLSDCVIILDGDFQNVHVSNLALRPRWFAWKYTRQLKVPFRPHYLNQAVYCYTTGRHYPSIIACGMKEGLLFQDIWSAANRGGAVYPYRWQFEFV